MIIVSRAPLATAISAMRLNSHDGMATPLASTTARRGPLELDSSSGGNAMLLARPT
ncbi:MAG: hypothetical protein K0S70_4953, partial [Microbacterium sp.]|nr:hypothetical protein [Microbacterium sp.]